MTPEQAAAAARLTREQLEFANLWLTKPQSGMTDVECYLAAYPKVSDKSASVNASKLIRHNANVRAYIQSHYQEAFADNIASLTELKEQLTAIARADITDVARWDVSVDEEGNQVMVPRIRRFEDVPQELRELVKSITYTKQGPKLEFYDKMQAIDKLIKMQGGFVERVEHSGVVGSVTASLPPSDAPIEDFTKVYREMLTAAQK